MVFFCCSSCGTCLKKNQMEKHVFQCRCTSVSCMDCQKDFGIKEYGAHIKCVSEKEKYGGANWQAPANFNKGEKKQEAWVDTVNNTLKKGGATLTPACKSLLQAISKHDNVPRKKPKFMNFVRNISRNKFDERTIETVFNLVDAEWKAQAEASKPVANPVTTNGQKKSQGTGKENAGDEDSDPPTEVAGTPDDDATPEGSGVAKLSKREKKEARRQKQNKEEKKSKRSKNSVSEDVDEQEDQVAVTVANGHKESKKEKKKRKRVESASELEKKKTRSEDGDDEEPEAADEAEEAEEESVAPGDFKWGLIIKEILEKQPDHEISMKKLKKKVLSEYYAVVGDAKGNKTQEELISKLNKKLKKQQFKVIRDTVRLVTA